MPQPLDVTSDFRYRSDEWAYCVYYDLPEDDGTQKRRHYAVHNMGEVREIEWSPYEFIPFADFVTLKDLGWPGRIGIGQLNSRDVEILRLREESKRLQYVSGYLEQCVETKRNISPDNARGLINVITGKRTV